MLYIYKRRQNVHKTIVELDGGGIGRSAEDTLSCRGEKKLNDGFYVVSFSTLSARGCFKISQA